MSKRTKLIYRTDAGKKPYAVARSWKRLESWFATNIPEVLETLWAGATDSQIDQFERTIGQALPDDLHASLRVHDGQEHWPDIGLIFGMELSPFAYVIEEWQWWKKEAESSETGGTPIYYEGKSFPHGAVRMEYANKGWIPLCADAGGNRLGIDLCPGPNGSVGQVINFGRDEEYKCVLARSWAQFLEDIAVELEQGNFLISQDDDGFKTFRLGYSEGRHFLDTAMPWSRAKLGLHELEGSNADLWRDGRSRFHWGE